MKIAIIGYSGSGKSTLAREIAAIYETEVLHLDAVQFLPNWEVRSHEEKEKIVGEFLETHDSWVIDGNYSSLYYEQRMKEADLIVEMLFNRFASLYRVTKRFFHYRNQTRPDMGEGCNEKLDAEFVWWVLRNGRKKGARERYKRVAKQYADKTVVIKNQRQLDRFLEEQRKYR